MPNRLDRRQVILGAGALPMVSSLLAPGSVQAWQSGLPQDRGFASDLADKLEAGIRSGLLRDLHSVLVVRDQRLVLERYYEGADESWGRSLGHVAFDKNTLHDLRSVTKSVVGLLYGIALERGLVPPLDAPLMRQFPEYSDLAADPQRAALTVEHVLTMTLGTEWNERLPYSDPANSEIMMERAEDRYRFILDRPIVAPPGSVWTYNGGCAALLGRLIARGSGQTLADFAGTALFAPLGISTFEWIQGRDGVHFAASGLRLRPRDLARVGEMVLARGRWGRPRNRSRGLARGLLSTCRCCGRRFGVRPTLVPRQGPGAGLQGAATLDRRLRERRSASLAHALRRSFHRDHGRQIQRPGRLGHADAGLARDRAG